MGRQNKTTGGENGGASATEEANVKQGAAGVERDKVPAIMPLEVPFEFEGETYESIDLSGLATARAEDMCEVDEEAKRQGDSSINGLHPEITRKYAMLLACRLNRKPYNWLDKMNAKDSIRLRETVTAFFYFMA
nr:MAG TPA: tail assembly chaperone protein [Caudoviricetes sp.]